MILTRVNQPQSIKFNLTETVSFLWCSDGMCYIPELKQRRSYFLEKGVLKMELQPWEGLIPRVEYSEQLEVLHSTNPLAWREKFLEHDDLYVVSNQTHNSTKM